MRNKVFWETSFAADTAPTEQQLARHILDWLRSTIPSSWTLGVDNMAPRKSERRADLSLMLSDPLGVSAPIVVEITRYLEPKQADLVIRQVPQYAAVGTSLLVVSAFISRRTQDLLASSGINFLDATGNLRLRLDRPAIYVERSGASDNPWREGRTLRSLKGPAAARIVRALCDYRPPYEAQDLAARAKAPPGTVSKVLALLDREALIKRASRGKYPGQIHDVDWPHLIQRWTQDYIFEHSNTTAPYLDPRGLENLFTQLKKSGQPYAITGSFASVNFAPIVQPRLATVYVKDIEQAGKRLSLHQAERGANILLAQPLDAVVFARTLERKGLTYAAFSQVAADLLTSPGRGPQEGAALIDWMKENEDAWRK